MALLFRRFGAVFGADEFTSLLRARHRQTLKLLVSSGCFGGTSGLSEGGLVFGAGLCEGGLVYAAERGDLTTVRWLLGEMRGNSMPDVAFFQDLLSTAMRAQSHHIVKVSNKLKLKSY